MTQLPITAEWVLDEDLPFCAPENSLGWLGGNPENPTWEEYLADFSDDFHPFLEAIRKHCEDNQLDLYGEDMNNGAFLLSDGRQIGFTWRGWGDFRQAMVGKREGYMQYYMR